MGILPDVLAENLDIVFCGSAAGRVSAARGAYYAHPQNRFWATLARVGLTPRRLAPEEFRSLPRYGLGLTDVCQRASGGDDELPREADDPAAVIAKVRRVQPRWLAFVGKRPAKVVLGRGRVDYGEQPERIGRTRVFVLPSPSPRASAWWDPAWWERLAALVRRKEGRA